MKKSDAAAAIILVALVLVAIFLAVFTWRDQEVDAEKKQVRPALSEDTHAN